MFIWALLLLVPLPLIIFTLNPALFRALDQQQDDIMKDETTPVNQPNSKKDTILSQKQNKQELNIKPSNQTSFAKLKHFLFKTRNSVLQCILATIVYGGFGIFLMLGHQHLVGFDRVLSLATVAVCMVLFAFASFSTPHGLYSPIHKDHQPEELKSINLASSCDQISPQIEAAVKERFDEFWYSHVGKYPYDNTIYYQNTWCKECQQPRPARSQHCALCGYCVPRSDHHCWWLNTHVGAGNYKIFLLFLLSHVWLVTYGTYIMFTVMNTIAQSINLDQILYEYLISNGHDQWYDFPMIMRFFYKQQYLCTNHALLWFITALITFLSIPVVLFTGYHCRLVLLNITTNEDTKRSYLQRWLSQTQQDLFLEESYHDIDTKLLKISSNTDRKAFINATIHATNISAPITSNPHRGVTNDGLDVVGCVGPMVTTPNLTANTPIKSPNQNNCSSHTTTKGTNDCQPCQRIDITRLPFPTIVPSPIDTKYELTEDEQSVEEMISAQARPIGYQGWFEPPLSPFHTTSTSTIIKNGRECALPSPQLWTREYFTFAVNQNIYNLGIWNNILDALDLSSPQSYFYTTTAHQQMNIKNIPFKEHDLTSLLRLRDVASTQFPKMTTSVDGFVDDTKEPVEIPTDKVKTD